MLHIHLNCLKLRSYESVDDVFSHNINIKKEKIIPLLHLLFKMTSIKLQFLSCFIQACASQRHPVEPLPLFFFSTTEQEEEEDRLHSIQRLCPDMAAKRKPGYENKDKCPRLVKCINEDLIQNWMRINLEKNLYVVI